LEQVGGRDSIVNNNPVTEDQRLTRMDRQRAERGDTGVHHPVLTYGVTSISKACRVFYFAVDPSAGFQFSMNARRLKDRQIAAQLRPGNFGTECWKDSYRRAQYASIDIVVNIIPEDL
jgi:hypothetical protein